MENDYKEGTILGLGENKIRYVVLEKVEKGLGDGSGDIFVVAPIEGDNSIIHTEKTIFLRKGSMGFEIILDQDTIYEILKII